MHPPSKTGYRPSGLLSVRTSRYRVRHGYVYIYLHAVSMSQAPMMDLIPVSILGSFLISIVTQLCRDVY